MNLNEPVFDSVLAIDAQLQKLQAEVAQMDSEFADYKPHSQALRDLKKQSTSGFKSNSLSPEIQEEYPAKLSGGTQHNHIPLRNQMAPRKQQVTFDCESKPL